ncbi:MAG TPA: ATP-dependent DNA ligase [Phycicoccus sp.]|nr:ATP-dependent DNA ligase [Phycicoccus sp.]
MPGTPDGIPEAAPAAPLPLSALVQTVEHLRSTSGRRAKVETLAQLLARTHPDEVEAVVGLLVGRIRQGRIGLGWRTLSAASDAHTPATEPTVTIAEVDAALSQIAALSGPGSTQTRARAVADLFAAATAPERNFLGHSILGDVRTGALDGILTEAAALAAGVPAARMRRAVMLLGDLGAATRLALTDPDALEAVTLRVGVPVQPMLASTAADVAAALAITGLASVEHKLDGARIQVHRKGSTVTVHTRSLADITDRVPEIADLARGLPGDSFILDGETLVLDASGAPRPFQETMSRFGSHAAQALTPRFFDVLALDGVDVTDRPLLDRRALLADLVGSDHLIPGLVTDDPETAQGVLREALAAGHEGVLVKGADTAYTAGRRGKAWVKVKPVHTYDLVVLAAEWGYGRRQGWLSNLHLGAVGADGEFVMVGKTFKGLTDELLRWQTATFPRYAVRETPGVVWLRPALVVEIAIDGVQRSTRYPGGLALRFARVKRYREDKSPHEADRLETLAALLRA